MTKCRPSKWVPWAFLGAGLPLLAAAVYEGSTHQMTDAIGSRAATALSSDETTAWAKVESNRRDFIVQGTAPSQEAVDKAIAAVAGTYGVRTIASNIQIVEPVKLIAPTVESVTSAEATPTIKGTWHEGVAKSLSIGLAGKTYKMGESPELSTLAGEWTLKPAAVAEGSYDIAVESSDGKDTLTATAGKLVIDLPDPVKLALPTVLPFIGNVATPTFKGTWPEVEAKAIKSNLQVKVGENMFVLGKTPELNSDGAGNWSLTPSVPMAEGEFEVMPGVVDVDGKWTKAESAGKALIDLTPPPAPEIVAPAAGAVWPFAVTGKWAEAAGASLLATLAGRTYAVNKDADLKSDGQGNFTFAPAAVLTPGSYDIDFAVNDAAGNVTTQKLAAAIIIPEPAPPAVPAIPAVVESPVAGKVWPYAIAGTWDEKPGNSLSANVQGNSYELGKGPDLTSSGTGKFSFQPTTKFAPGNYDVDFTTNDATGVAKVTTLKAAIVVPEPPPPPPPVIVPAALPVIQAPAANAVWPYAITGTWDEKPDHSLAAKVDGHNYVLGKDPALTSVGTGKFSFAPTDKFAPGKYDVTLTTTDKTPDAKVVVLKDAIVVPEPPPPPPPPPPPKPKLPVPTVTSQVDLTGAPLIKGTWPHDKASVLAVNLAGRNYMLGKDANLRAKDGNWTLLPGTALADGVYDVKVGIANADGILGKDESKDELTVAATQPVAPSIMTMSGDVSPDHLSGTWDHTMAKTLKISIPQVNVSAELGAAGTALVTDTDGKWRLNLTQALPVGSYNIVAETTDQYGRKQVDASEGEVVIVAKGEPPVVRAIVPYDCVAVMNRIGNVFPIRFEYDLTDITKPFDLSVSQYASLLKDKRCESINVEVKGHADFKGTEIYNEHLSERRAELIVSMLKEAGVAESRMSVKALGESSPLDPSLTDEARMKNRRVEITAKP